MGAARRRVAPLASTFGGASLCCGYFASAVVGGGVAGGCWRGSGRSGSGGAMWGQLRIVLLGLAVGFPAGVVLHRVVLWFLRGFFQGWML